VFLVMKTIVLSMVVLGSFGAIACKNRQPGIAQTTNSNATPPSSSNVDGAPPEPALDEARVHVPGTGVTFVAPVGVHLAPVGSMLTDAAGEILVSVTIGPAGNSPERAESWLAMYPSAPESVSIGAFSGRLRYRTRDRDGGTSDGWALVLCDTESCLLFTISDSGREHERWRRWRRNALSVDWRPAEIDPELALGVTLGSVPGMRVDSAVAGLLSYRADVKGVHLTVLGIPRSLSDEPEVCVSSLRAVSEQVEFSAPVAIPRSKLGFHGCEMVTKGGTAKGEYWAAVGTPTGGVLMVSGDAPASVFSTWRPRFEAAVRTLRPTPGRAGK
jgi:hypothetical protein